MYEGDVAQFENLSERGKKHWAVSLLLVLISSLSISVLIWHK